MHLFSIFILRHSRSDEFLCGKAAWTKEQLRHQPQQKNSYDITFWYNHTHITQQQKFAKEEDEEEEPAPAPKPIVQTVQKVNSPVKPKPVVVDEDEAEEGEEDEEEDEEEDSKENSTKWVDALQRCRWLTV